MKKWFLLAALVVLTAGAQLTNAPQPYGYVWDPALRQWRMDQVQGMTEQLSASGVHTLVVPPGPAGASVAVVTEPSGANCVTGGVKLTSVSGVNYICNGAAAAPPAYTFGAGLVAVSASGQPTAVSVDTAYVLYRGGPVPTGPGSCTLQGTGVLLVDPGGQWLYVCVPTADGTGFQWTRFGGGQTNWVAGQ